MSINWGLGPLVEKKIRAGRKIPDVAEELGRPIEEIERFARIHGVLEIGLPEGFSGKHIPPGFSKARDLQTKLRSLNIEEVQVD